MFGDEVVNTFGMTVKDCVRCGGEHRSVVFKTLSRPSGDWTHWATCPATSQPIMVGIGGGSVNNGPSESVLVAEDQRTTMLALADRLKNVLRGSEGVDLDEVNAVRLELEKHGGR